MADITGKTAVMLMLADPVSHIRGTALINASFGALGLDAVILPLHVAPADLKGTLLAVRRMQNVAGLGITIPHKVAAWSLVDDLTPEARRMGATNFIRRTPDGSLIGTNTDGAGFIAGLRTNGFDPQGKRAFLSGTGGVGRAIAFALAEAGVAALALTNRDMAKAEALATEIRRAAPACAVTLGGQVAGMDLVVNGTSLGMHPGDALPLDLTGLSPRTTVAEVVVQPAMTSFLTEASVRGCQVIPGAEMLKPQPALVAAFFGLLNQG